MEWITDPLTIGVLVLVAALAFAVAVFRHWSARATAEYVVGGVLMLVALRWAIEIGGEAVYAAAVAGIGTGLAHRAIERGARRATEAAGKPG